MELKSTPYKICRLKLEHLHKINVRDAYLADVEFLKQNKGMQDVYLKGSPFFTLFHNDDIIMIYGCHNSGFGTYIPLFLPSNNIRKHSFAVTNAVFDYVQECVGPDVRRFEAVCNISDETAVRFAKWFGFEVVGIKRQSSAAGEDQLLLERLYRKGDA